MKIFNHIHSSLPFDLKSWGLLLISAVFSFVYAQAQIVIHGNVYGGGDKAVVKGNTSVQVISGNLEGAVFGGARMADVDGNAFVNIDGKTEGNSDYILINEVYGGNDMAGVIGGNKAYAQSKIPEILGADAQNDGVNETWDAFVHISNKKVTETINEGQENEEEIEKGDLKKIYIGSLYGGGNHADIAKTYVDIHGGSIVYAYGGGNAATVTESTIICVDNPSDVVNHIIDENNTDLLNTDRFKSMGVSGYKQAGSGQFQIGRLFGGNNLADMSIRPRWHLESGSARNVYGGGNRGNMNHIEGLLIDIPSLSTIRIDNLYGGCRMADVKPLNPDTQEEADHSDIQLTEIDDETGEDKYKFPAGLSARVLVNGGDVNNVYGGNDITGHVVGGNAVGIHALVHGNVYGGGNGSYPYTDNIALKDDDEYGDFYYDADAVLEKAGYDAAGIATLGDLKSATALSLFRPDAEQVVIHLSGTVTDTTIIGGSVYCGGNSATIRSSKANPKVELKIGSYVIADNVFMGNNGEDMVKYNDELWADNGDDLIEPEGVLKTMSSTLANDGSKYNSINLKQKYQFATYMDGAAMDLIPTISFDSRENGDANDYVPYSTYIGSFYCGGNRGSMTYPGTNTMDMDAKVIVYEKVVGGCHDAYIEPTTDYNAEYIGGVIGTLDERAETDGKTAYQNQTSNDRLVLNFNGVKIEPKRWALKHGTDNNYIVDNGNYVQDFTPKGNPYLEWNTIGLDENDEKIPIYYKNRTWHPATTDMTVQQASDAFRRLDGGNIYGGCHESGVINGNVVINLNHTLIERDSLFVKDQETVEGDYIIPEGVSPDSKKDWKSGVILYNQASDVLTVAMIVFVAGYGEKTEIWGSTNINLKEGYAFQLFGGGYAGVVGKKDADGEYYFDHDYSTYVRLDGKNPGYSPDVKNGPVLAETEYIYGGGNKGDVCGGSHVYLGNGRIYDSFGGASDADVFGSTETFIGYADGFPWVRDIVYGGNDFSGTIGGGVGNYHAQEHWDNVRSETKKMVYGANPNDLTVVPDIIDAPIYVEYRQGYVDTIFGGNYGNYDYYDDSYMEVGIDQETGDPVDIVRDMPFAKSTFVHISPIETENSVNSSINAIFGGSTGYLGDRRGDKNLDHSYILIDIPETMDNFSHTEIFGSGSYSGLGMRKELDVLPRKAVAEAPIVEDPEAEGYQEYQDYLAYQEYQERLDNASAIIDLIRGKVGVAYGGSYNEGITRRTLVNVPKGSKISIGSIFGGAYGNVTVSPCDVYEAHVEYHSSTATLRYDPLRIFDNSKAQDDPQREILLGYDPEKNAKYIDGTAQLAAGQEVLGSIYEKGAIYGGNNFRRRTLYSKINIDSRVNQLSYAYGNTTGYVYGAGCGENTWSEYTEVNLNEGASIWEVYGGGQNGLVINAPSIQKYINEYSSVQGLNIETVDDPGEDATDEEKAEYNAKQKAVSSALKQWKESWSIGSGYDGDGMESAFSSAANLSSYTEFYAKNEYTNLKNPLVTPRDEFGGKRFNTNVIINKGAIVYGYAYGGGLGSDHSDPEMVQSGNIYGTTYIALLGGTVSKDIYAAGSSGDIGDMFAIGPYDATDNPYGYTASTTAYIEGGTARNVYGGGWEGSVGLATTSPERPGESNVIIGIRPELYTDNDYGFYKGVPAIQRNAYGGGEGGSIIGTANITLNNGYIGYVHLNKGKNDSNVEYREMQDAQGWIEEYTLSQAGQNAWDNWTEYDEKINDETYKESGVWKGSNRLEDCGNLYGSGYDDMSSVDEANVYIWGGTVRNSVFGGGEIATVGRGLNNNNNNNNNNTLEIIKPGSTHIEMYNGHVLRNVFGAGKGYNNLRYGKGHELHTDGYVFGKTDVNIYGGEIGTTEGIALGYGNVFGGGDRGFVFSTEGTKSGTRYNGTDEGYYYKTVGNDKVLTEDCKVLIEPRLQVTASSKAFTDPDGDGPLTAETFDQWNYVPIDYLNTLPIKQKGSNNWDEAWNGLDVGHSDNGKYIERGIKIHNAVFAGGNSSSNDDKYANAITVFGNATATIHDVYNRDFITIGTERTGGLYGDGNLTFVDGYRELNISNYGTDYYHIANDITYSVYQTLPEREQAYYELQYTCKTECTDREGTSYSPGATIPQEELYALFDGVLIDENTPMIGSNGKPHPDYWTENGVVLRAPGRGMNTIQRADFCGVFGSRMVMRGAQDRVPQTVDYTNYTINRVREVSLNASGPNDERDGNYFGIYSIVNYLGALTSDVDFYDARRETLSSGNGYAEDDKTFAEWKQAKIKDRTRNDGISRNKVALASGVYLEITSEQSSGKELGQKVWGYITGVVELDLINVSTGLGGGFVYAKNEHGTRKKVQDFSIEQYILTKQNKTAVTNRKFYYEDIEEGHQTEHNWQSSGNFVRSVSGFPIIDDCYNKTGNYYGQAPSPAHYWFIKGQIYVYDQVISAYTGTPNAYSEIADIPLSISTGANGKLQLIDVQPSLYAYYASANSNTPLSADGKFVLNVGNEDKTFHLNDPISYWDWTLLNKAEQKLFVKNTYVVREDCTIGGTPYVAGKVLLEEEYNTLAKSGENNAKPTVIQNKQGENKEVDFDLIVRSSNNVSHDAGYILTFDINNPGQWDKWYTPISDSYDNGKKINRKTYDALQKAVADLYYDGPTYSPTLSGLYGQREYSTSEIISKDVYDKYQAAYTTWSGLEESARNTLKPQAVFKDAWITTDFITYNNLQLEPGTRISKSQFGLADNAEWPSQLSSKVDELYISSSTIKLPDGVRTWTDNGYITADDIMTEAELTDISNDITTLINAETNDTKKASLQATLADINAYVVRGYINTSVPTEEVKHYYYGGEYFYATQNYRGHDAWSSMSESDRSNFTFNYDALDLLIDPSYKNEAIISGTDQGKKYQYDAREEVNQDGTSIGTTLADAQANKAGYSQRIAIDYEAVYSPDTDKGHPATITYNKITGYDGNGHPITESATAKSGTKLSREEFEMLLNEQGHYSPIKVQEAGTVYVVNTAFAHNEPFAVGEIISAEQFGKLDDTEKGNITQFVFTTDQVGTYYYCNDEYVIASEGDGGKPVSTIALTKSDNTTTAVGTITYGGTVPVGSIISDGKGAGAYGSLTNNQKHFLIQGITPLETSTLYVSRNSDINDLSKEKIITVIYQYDYTESDEDGENITPISERHVLNIHLQFKSGFPTVGDILPPSTVLPGTTLGLNTPKTTPGAYEIIGEGWELYPDESYAISHTNGIEYTPTVDSMYWYQDGYYLAYYCKTYLGKAYSNHVPVSVANYHDLKDVMDDKKYHMHVDFDNTQLHANSKIYINSYSGEKDGIDLLKDFFDLSVLSATNVTLDGKNLIASGAFQGHAKLNTSTKTINDQSVMVGVLGGANLDFILRTNINHTGSWTSIANGNSDPCFDGTLHGDGFTISGLDNSLFKKLCGEVYNLGVTGSFSGAGIADSGDGYIESCWISTTGTPDNTVYAVFGDPQSTVNNRKQLVNSYYPETLGYKTTVPDQDNLKRGIATPMPKQSFYNGEVAYNLNSFYLNKRYYDGHGKDESKGDDYYISYKYLDPTITYALDEDQFSLGYYPSANHLDDYAQYGDLGYVEERYMNGDFRYAAGTIPNSEERRFIEYKTVISDNVYESHTEFAPIWPDDYIFFGQHLTYGYDNTTHQDVPSHYNGNNRVMRAPAYFGKSEKDAAYFNSNAYLPDMSADGTHEAYPGMTALDLTGSKNGKVVAITKDDFTQGVQESTDLFYTPLLDYTSLSSFRNDGQTQNMLVYVNRVKDEATTTIINEYFKEPEYKKYTNKLDGEGVPTNTPNDAYGSIRKVSFADSTAVRGHLVIWDGTDYYVVNDQFLVDKQDFNAPIEYNMEKSDGESHYETAFMWYQRQPDHYVKDNSSGWESISLPFTAAKVTTSQKGDITHFYRGGSNDDSHEYWLRTPDKIDSQDASKILFQAIGNGTGTESGTVSNTTFLWDYYYRNINSGSGPNRKDANGDTYQEYYSTVKNFNNYPLASKGQPYLIGFPSERYYEFDLSGSFKAQHTDVTAPAQLDKQTITFVSGTNVTINVSDADYENATSVSGGNYAFKPTYQTKELDGPTTWLLNSAGTAFQNNDTENVKTVPFRAYITATSSGGGSAPRRAGTRAENITALYIGYQGSQDQLNERKADGGLLIYGENMNICIESTLDYEAQVTIHTTAGKLLKQFTIQPGTKATVPVNNRGIYIVNRHKVAVTK